MIIQKPKKFSSLAFIFATIGAAVGLGNIWRFPQKMAANGGSSFIFIYLIILVVLVLPVIFLEIQYGVFFKRNPIDCFSRATKRKSSRIFGWAQILCVLLLCLYYTAVTAWVLTSFANYVVPERFKNVVEKIDIKTGDFLTKEFTGAEYMDKLTSTPVLKDFFLWIWIAIGIIIVFVIFVLGFGRTKMLGKVNLVIVPALLFLLVGLLIYALTLSGAKASINHLFKFDLTKWTDLSVWGSALEQAIFSTGILFGIFIIYSATSDVRIDKANDAIIVVAADTIVGIMAAIIITCVLASEKGNDITGNTPEEKLVNFFDNSKNGQYGDVNGGPGLVFAIMPWFFLKNFEGNFTVGYTLNLLFFITLFFAAFSSLIALVSSFSSTIQEQLGVSNARGLFFSVLLIFLGSFIYCVGEYSDSSKIQVGPALVGSQDKFVLFTIMVIGVFEVFFFAISSQLKPVLKYSEKYSYLKLSRFGIFRFILLFLVVPAFIYMAAVQSIKIINSFFKVSQKFVVEPFFNITAKAGNAEISLVNGISIGIFGLAMFLALVFFIYDFVNSKKIRIKFAKLNKLNK